MINRPQPLLLATSTNIPLLTYTYLQASHCLLTSRFTILRVFNKAVPYP